MERARIRLDNRLNKKMFEDALSTCDKRKHELNDFDYDFVTKLNDGYLLAGDSMTVSVKQMNYLKQIAIGLETGR